jgi:hypothetical protein
MPVDKLIPRKLNSDIDAKLIDKASMIDALNLYAGDDIDGGGGVLKNVKGNTQVAQGEGDLFGDDSRVLGSVTDDKTGIAYFFVYSTQAKFHGVWAYDPEGKLEGDGEPAVRLIYRDAQFNFPSTGFVKGDIVHVNSATFSNKGDEFDKDAIIFFTDNVNEPRKINAYRAYQAGGSEIYSSVYDTADFITACPKTPLEPITFKFDRDVNRKTTNFLGTSGFQFAYQHVYKDGFESAVSSYSDVAFPPSIIAQGALSYASHENYNRCILYLPKPGAEIKSVKVLAREGETGSFLLIDEIDPSTLYSDGAYVGAYSFYNDRITKGFSEVEVNKQFDSVPRKAKAQAVSDNRLMYGNYLDGFNPVQVDCTAQVVYRQRPEDFVDFTLKSNPFIGVHTDEDNINDAGSAKRKSAGFTIDASSLPESAIAGTTILVKVTMTPDRNWHIYNSDNSYHQSRLIGEFEEHPVSTDWNTFNNQTPNQYVNYELQSVVDSGLNYLRGYATPADGHTSLWQGANSGIKSSGLDLGWKKKYHPDGSSETVYSAKIGSSAANPIILNGGSILFQAGFTTSVEIPSGFSVIAAKTIEEILLGVDYADLTYQNRVSESGFVQSVTPTLNHSLPVSNHTLISQSYIGQQGDGTDLSRMIMAVMRDSPENERWVPQGYVIFKNATAKFKLRQVDNDFGGPTKKAFRLCLSSLTDVKPMTCYKSMFAGTGTIDDLGDYPFLNQWGVIDPEVEFFDADGSSIAFDPDNHLGYYGDFDVGDLYLDTGNEDNTYNGAQELYKNMLGCLLFDSSPTGDLLAEDEDLGLACIFDGEGGPGGGPSRDSSGGNTYDDLRMNRQGSIPLCAPLVVDPSLDSSFATVGFVANNDQGDWSTVISSRQSPMWTGRISLAPADSTHYLSFGDTNKYASMLPLLQNTDRNTANVETAAQSSNYIADIVYPNPQEGDPGVLDAYSVNWNHLHSSSDISSFVSGSYGGDVFRSFKSNSNHEFGIVYYDERGRHGFVNYLSNVFVPGLSSVDRPEGSEGGPASVALTLNHQPPSWAHYYKIVYGGNSTIDSFIQYSVPNAYVRDYEEDFPPDTANIYVSLNYLQGNPISYVSSFGARSVEGGLNMYKFKQGDKLRIISTGPDENRTYYQSGNYEFDIIDLVDVAAPIEGEDASIVLVDPIETSNDSSPQRQGQFLVLRDNLNADGFKFTDVSAGGSTNKWTENCIVEIYTPSKKLAEDEKFYYEMPGTYRVITTPQDNLAHSPSTVVINKGDVWFRKGALNWKENSYTDLIAAESTGKSESNFKSIFVEASSATDLHRSDFKGLGRANLINDNAKEVRREASVTYSDKSNPESSKSRYTSFDSNKLNFNDYDYNKGEISFLSPTSGYLIVLQDARTSIVPISKNVLSDASGSANLVSSNVVLGEAIEQAGVGGSDSPESVVERDDKIYYANKGEGKIYLYSKGSGAKDISTNFIGAVLRKEINSLSGSVKIVGGYDSLKEEYLVTILPFSELITSGVTVAPQPQIEDLIDTVGPSGISGPSEEEDGLGISGFQVFVDTDGDGIIGINEFLNQTSIDTSTIGILGAGQIAVTPSLEALTEIAEQIVVGDAALIPEALFSIGTSISSGGVVFDEEDVLSNVISTYAADNSLDITNAVGISALFSAAGLTEAALAVEQGAGDGTGTILNPASNYDLVAKLIDNGTDGWQVGGVYAQDNVIVNQELLNVASVLGLTGPENDVVSADLNVDGIVGQSDLLILLSQYAEAAPEPEPVDPNLEVFTISEETDEGDGVDEEGLETD